MDVNPDIKWAQEDLARRKSSYQLYSNYYEGKHQLAFATKKWRNAFGLLFQQLRENLCAPVVDAVADRLALAGMTFQAPATAVAGPAPQPAPAAQDFNLIWRANRCDELTGEVHHECIKLGDAYVIVWPDMTGVPRLYCNEADCMTVRYDPENPGMITLAAKFFNGGKDMARCNLYYPDRIEKWVARKGGKFEPFNDQMTGWTFANQFGRVPVFHFRNHAAPGKFGKSELRNVVPLQDALNKEIADLLVGSEYYSLPRRYGIGIEFELDPKTGKPKGWNPDADTMLTTPAPDAKFGQFDPADLSRLVIVIDSLRTAIARVTGTPLHLLNLMDGNFPSGEALKVAEERLTAKVGHCQLSFGNNWEDVFSFALAIRGYANQDLDAAWNNTAPRSQLDEAQTVTLRRNIGISRRQGFRDLGYTETQINRIEMELDEEDARARERAAQNGNLGF